MLEDQFNTLEMCKTRTQNLSQNFQQNNHGGTENTEEQIRFMKKLRMSGICTPFPQ